MRRLLYLVARLLGDVNAARKGKIGRRIGWRFLGRGLGRILRELFR